MANRAESLNLPAATLDTTLDREEDVNVMDEMPAENQLVYQTTLRTPDAAAANNELRHFIGQEEFEDGVQRWKEVRYYHYYYYFFYPHLSKKTDFLRERERGGERERKRNQNIIIFNFF